VGELLQCENYLALQKLYAEIPQEHSLTSAQIAAYNDLLSEVENHKEIDDKMARVSSHLTLTTRNPTIEEIKEVRRFKRVRFTHYISIIFHSFDSMWINYECGA
jgi:hypothetical protein